MIRIAILAALCVSLGGCLTDQVTRSLRLYRSTSREWASLEDLAAVSPFTGVYTGEVEVGGVRYSRYLFAGLLGGPSDRLLEILLVPRPGPDLPCRAIIRDTTCDIGSETGAQATLTIHNLQLRGHDDTDRTEPPDADLRTERLLRIEFSYYAGPTIFFAVPEAVHGNATWESAEARVDLDWVVRSHLVYDLMHLKYLLATPIDIITAPLWIPIVGFLTWAGN